MKWTPCLFFCVLLAPMITFGANAEEKYGRAADNRINAQVLVNRILSSDASLISVGMHVVSPGTDQFSIIATTLDVVGKKCDPADLEVAHEGKTVITPNLPKSKLGILLPLRNRAGEHIGGLALAFKYHEGDDQAKLLAEAISLRNILAKDIPQVSDLFATSSLRQ